VGAGVVGVGVGAAVVGVGAGGVGAGVGVGGAGVVGVGGDGAPPRNNNLFVSLGWRPEITPVIASACKVLRTLTELKLGFCWSTRAAPPET